MSEIISLSVPVERLAVESKTFGEAYIMDLTVSAQSMGPQDSIYIQYAPYDQASGERLLSDRREVRLPLWDAIQAVPEVAAAYTAIIAAISPLIAYQEAQAAAAVPEP